MMKSLILIGCLVVTGIAASFVGPTISLASLAYTRVSVEAVDMALPSLTFRTTEGQVWTLPAASADLLKGLQKGDTCSVEIDLENRVTKIVKVDSTSP
ncbi:MAG: hypothetical protein HY348_07535 [Nitrospira defluvii]|nr:hypothetical protein [Nitrospira defluvii]